MINALAIPQSPRLKPLASVFPSDSINSDRGLALQWRQLQAGTRGAATSAPSRDSHCRGVSSKQGLALRLQWRQLQAGTRAAGVLGGSPRVAPRRRRGAARLIRRTSAGQGRDGAVRPGGTRAPASLPARSGPGRGPVSERGVRAEKRTVAHLSDCAQHAAASRHVSVRAVAGPRDARADRRPCSARRRDGRGAKP